MRTSQSKISSDGIRFSKSLKNKKSRESYSHGNPQKVFVILFLWCCYCYLYCCFILQYVYHIMLSASYHTFPWFIARFTLMDSHLYYTFSLIHCRVISSAICNFSVLSIAMLLFLLLLLLFLLLILLLFLLHHVCYRVDWTFLLSDVFLLAPLYCKCYLFDICISQDFLGCKQFCLKVCRESILRSETPTK